MSRYHPNGRGSSRDSKAKRPRRRETTAQRRLRIESAVDDALQILASTLDMLGALRKQEALLLVHRLEEVHYSLLEDGDFEHNVEHMRYATLADSDVLRGVRIYLCDQYNVPYHELGSGIAARLRREGRLPKVQGGEGQTR